MLETKFKLKHGVLGLPAGKTRQVGFFGQWTNKKLGDHADIYRGGSPRPIESFITDDINGINWIKIGDVDPAAKYIRSTTEKIKPSGVSSTRLVHKGDLILSNSMSFGRPYILELDGAIHDGWLVIQNYQKTFNTDFLYYALSSDAVMAQYKTSAAGSSVQNLNKDKVADVVICAPDSLDEQKRIASALSSVDELIASLDKQIAKTRDIRQGAMQQLLTALPSTSCKPLREVGQMQRGTSTTRKNIAEGEIPVIAGGQLPAYYCNKSNRSGETITVAGSGEYAGYVAYWETPIFVSDAFSIKKGSELCMTKYLYYVLKSMQREIYTTKKGAGVPHVHFSDIENFLIPLPSVDKQKRIASVLTSFDDIIEGLEAKRQKYESIKAGMMQQLLSGSIRLN